MRRCMTILAVCGILSGPTLSAADDPFDFSGPLSTTSRRPAQYFSRADEQGDTGDRLRLEGSGEQSPYRRAGLRPSETPPQNDAKDLFSDSGRTTADRPQSVSFGAETARERAASKERDPKETLRRFDEFLKTRDIVSADYVEDEGAPRREAIRQVQLESAADFDDLPSLGDLDTVEPPSGFGLPQTQRPQTALFGSGHGPSTPAAATPATTDARLTEPISTSPKVDSAPFHPHRPPPSARPQPKSQPTLDVGSFGTLSTQAPARHMPRYAVESDTTEHSSAPAIATTWKLLDPLNLGQECRAELTVTNTGEAEAGRVSLEVRLPDTVRAVHAVPAPVEQQAFLGWKLPALAGGESRTIEITFVATAPGALELATYVRHTSSRNESFTVTEPMLELALSGPAQVQVGEPASQMLLVKNPGTGIASNVTIEALIPEGLEHATGDRLQMDIGSLNPGEVRSVRLVMGAVSGGNHILQVQANADSGLVQTAAAEVTVIAPHLRTGIAGPSLRYVGREADYKIRVLNDGSGTTDFVQVNYRIPEGFDFVEADRGAKFDRGTRVLNWYVGQLESSQALDLNVTLVSHEAGEFVHAVRATSELGAQAEAQTTTRVEGIASLAVKVSDLDDPVEVGGETAYEITITNEGSAAAHDVGLTCEIPRGMTFLKASGPSTHRQQGAMVGFQPAADLAAGQTLTYRVHVRGDSAGDQRFRCRLTSEALTQPLFTEELTKFYGE